MARNKIYTDDIELSEGDFVEEKKQKKASRKE